SAISRSATSQKDKVPNEPRPDHPHCTSRGATATDEASPTQKLRNELGRHVSHQPSAFSQKPHVPNEVPAATICLKPWDGPAQLPRAAQPAAPRRNELRDYGGDGQQPPP